MQKRALTLALTAVSAAAVAATVAPRGELRMAQSNPVPTPPAPSVQIPFRAPAPAPAPVYSSPAIGSAVSQWHALRQSDNLPFSSYASFLTRYRGWPGETGLRKTAERAIDPGTTSPGQITAFFRAHPALTLTGHARHAFALLAEGNPQAAREAARQAWTGGVLQRSDEERLLSLFGSQLTQQDHDHRMEQLLDNGDTQSAQRTLPLASPGRRAVYETRLALQARSSDAPARVNALGAAAQTDAGVLMDRAKYLRETGQSLASRALLASPRTLQTRPRDAEKWYETLLATARAAANDRNWQTAYQIASQVDDAYAPGTPLIRQSEGERDDYTSLAWLAATVALQELGRPQDAMAMFLRYARGGKSAQVTSKGLYWAARAAEAAGQRPLANVYLSEAATYPELFYGQLALERLGRPLPAPAASQAPTLAERQAFQSRDLVAATRYLGQTGRWDDQSLFVRALSAAVDNDRDRQLAADFALQIDRPDLGVWLARNARNSGDPFYARTTYPQVRIPPAQSRYWSLAHGIIRQESSFDRAAVSHAGARGMMQLMPGTARETSGRLGLGYDLGRLTRDPDYNIMLGSRYFEGLMDYWNGSSVLAVASYNAGPGNVRKWLAANGDPRLPSVDVIRWIEEIPFSETRGYVQRVLENTVVYDTMDPRQAPGNERTRLSHYLGKPGRPG